MKRRRFIETAACASTVGVGILGWKSTAGGRSSKVSIKSIETFDLALRLNQLNGFKNRIPNIDELPAERQQVIQTAISETYRTDTVPEWLPSLLQKSLYIRDGADVYELQATIPKYVVTATVVDEGTISGPIASTEVYREAVTTEHRVHTGLIDTALETSYQTYDLHPKILSFLEKYEAVTYRGECVKLALIQLNTTAPYSIDAQPVSEATAYNGKILDVETLPADIQTPLRDAASTVGVYGVSSPPKQLSTLIKNHTYVRIDEAFYAAYVWSFSEPPIEFDARVKDTTNTQNQPGRLVLSLTNIASTSVTLTSGKPVPFGVLQAQPTDNSDGREGFYLWNDGYEGIWILGQPIGGRTGEAASMQIEAGDSVHRVYKLDSVLY